MRLAGPGLGDPSAVARAFAVEWLVGLAEAPAHAAEISFDGGELGRAVDLRPGLPLVLRW